MNPEHLIFAAAAQAARAKELCQNLWQHLPLNAPPVPGEMPAVE